MPGKPLVDLANIPGCARSCFDKANVCKKLTTNCVCSQPKPDCDSSTTTCKSNEVGLYDAWYAKSCGYNLTAMTTSISNPFWTEHSSIIEHPNCPHSTTGGGCEGLSKGAFAGAAVGAVTGTLALGVFLCSRWKRRDPGRGGPPAGPPGPYELEGSSDLESRPGLIPIMVQSTHLVEAPGDPR